MHILFQSIYSWRPLGNSQEHNYDIHLRHIPSEHLEGITFARPKSPIFTWQRFETRWSSDHVCPSEMLAAVVGTQHPAASFPHKCIAHDPIPCLTSIHSSAFPWFLLWRHAFTHSYGPMPFQVLKVCQCLHGLCPQKSWSIQVCPMAPHFHPLPKRPPNSLWETCSTAWGRGGWWDVTGHANTPMPHQCSKPNALPSWNVAWRCHRPRKSSAWACRSLHQGQKWITVFTWRNRRSKTEQEHACTRFEEATVPYPTWPLMVLGLFHFSLWIRRPAGVSDWKVLFLFCSWLVLVPLFSCDAFLLRLNQGHPPSKKGLERPKRIS